MKTRILSIVFILFVILSQNIFSQGWVIQPSGLTSTLRQVFFHDAQTGWTVGDGGKILKSTNGGISWNNQTSGTTQDLYSITMKDSVTFLVCGNNGVILKTTNGGTSWSPQPSGSTAKLKYVFYHFNDYFFACGENGTLLFTSNGGTAWVTYNSNTTEHLNFVYFEDVVSGFVFGNNGTIRRNSGSNPWVTISFPTSENLLGCSGQGVSGVVCTNIGNIYPIAGNYTAINTGVNTQLNAMSTVGYSYPIPPKIWCAGDNGVIRHSADTARTWTGQNISSSIIITSIFMLDSLRGWLVGTNGTISSTTTGGVIGIQSISSEVPKDYSLFQNYPNPFNPNSKIKFQIAKSGFTKLIVYDILGREISALVNEELNPGTYEADFDGSKLTSGIYFYKLVVGDNTYNGGFSETKKMILIK